MEKINHAISIVGSASMLARALGVTVQTVCFWRDGKRNPAAIYCSRIEKITKGEVSRKDLRPNDWHEIWPELNE